MTVRARALRALDTALAQLGHDPALAGVRTAVGVLRDDFARTMRVALVGRVSSGKSTLANALLEGDFAPTGILELTYNVTWLRHAPDPAVTVHFRDGRAPEPRDLADLAALAARTRTGHESPAYLAAISHLDVSHPNPRLRGYDLIDTPGLDALGGDPQAAKTLALLGRSAAEVTRETAAVAARADAIVLVFPRAVSTTDAAVAADFLQGGSGGPVDPVAVVGALTKIEHHWPDHDPLTQGARDAARLMRWPQLRRTAYEILPVAGRLAAAAARFTEQDHAGLAELAAHPDQRGLAARAENAQLFAAADNGLPLPADVRAGLWERFTGWGLVTACGLIREDPGTSAERLRGELAERSGLTGLRQLLESHFAARADAIKLHRTVTRAQGLADGPAARLSPRQRDTARRVLAGITRLTHDHALRELGVLRALALGELQLDAIRTTELARLCGRFGDTAAARLGAAADAGPSELVRLAGEGHARWSAAVLDPWHRAADLAACRTALAVYDGLLHDLTGTAERSPCP
ncbi:dynamin family protein [Kitasatospora sp. NPDC058965]|uniref:dynamin family protein n=1 Tax=Kitasatospora sp. NPDC058965 TaxID=3346682 RepID=UPI0036C7B2EA